MKKQKQADVSRSDIYDGCESVCYNCGNTSVINTPSQKIPTFEKVKEIIKVMDGLSEDGFKNKYFNDPHFGRGFDLLVHTFLKGE